MKSSQTQGRYHHCNPLDSRGAHWNSKRGTSHGTRTFLRLSKRGTVAEKSIWLGRKWTRGAGMVARRQFWHAMVVWWRDGLCTSSSNGTRSRLLKPGNPSACPTNGRRKNSLRDCVRGPTTGKGKANHFNRPARVSDTKPALSFAPFCQQTLRQRTAKRPFA